MLGPDQRSHSDQSPGAWPAVAAAGQVSIKAAEEEVSHRLRKRRCGEKCNGSRAGKL